MSEQGPNPRNRGNGEHQPIFLLPNVVTGLIGLMVAIHIAATLVLNEAGQQQLVFWFAFLPARITAASSQIDLALPLLWTPFTHALLHAGWEHLLLNMAWLAIFATPVARRYGSVPTLVMFFLCAAAGAALFAVTTLYTGQFLVGASGGIAGLTGAAVRFMFQPLLVSEDPTTGKRIILGQRLASLSGLMREPRARNFTLFWLIANGAVPLLPLLTGSDLQIAWQAHIGGFIAGLLLVGLFERRVMPPQ
ncbi:rhomboid family intramembrane serine protease [Devosia sp.]|uniref:rhomboid family intramembrane serine protease n=1 Tax=Devosia sp. TaxID=1871048 RepID=UPI003264955D